MGALYSDPQCSNTISISPINWNVVVMVIYLVLVRYFPIYRLYPWENRINLVNEATFIHTLLMVVCLPDL